MMVLGLVVGYFVELLRAKATADCLVDSRICPLVFVTEQVMHLVLHFDRGQRLFRQSHVSQGLRVGDEDHGLFRVVASVSLLHDS